MKYTEIALYGLDFSEQEIKSYTEKCVEYDVNCVSVPFAYTRICKNILKNTNTVVSNAIDYPAGISDIKTRGSAVLNSINNGAQKIDIVMQNSYLSNKKYDKIRQDIDNSIQTSSKYNIPINYYLEYRIFTHHSLIKACNILLEFGIENVYVSTGHMLDNIDDNLIAIKLLQNKTKIKPIFTANIWNTNHVKKLKKHDINSIRFNNINALNIYNEQKNIC